MTSELHTNHIALADILANGVVVLLILITLSLSVKQQDAEHELQQVSEIGAVMAREIGSSFITNALPSSSPAMLHDYNHPQHAKVPYIVMAKNQLLIKSAGDGKKLDFSLSKEELLQQDNRFDDFLRGLVTNKKTRIRMDIHHIKNYYLVLSILKKHKVLVSDWHFLGLETAGAGTDDFSSPVSQDEVFPDFMETELDDDLDEFEDEQGVLSEGVDFFSGEADGQFSSENGRGFGKGDGSEFGTQSGLGDEEMYREMERLMAKYSGLEDAYFVESLNINFSSSGSISGLEIPFKYGDEGGGEPVSKQLLAILLSYLADRQRAYQSDEFVEVSADDFVQARFPSVKRDYAAEIEAIYQSISTIDFDFIDIIHQHEAKSGAAFLVNKNLENSKIISQTKVQPTIWEENTLSIKLYPQPTIDNGSQVEISATDVILFAARHNENERFDWQLVAVLNAQLNAIEIGFVYAKYTKYGLLLSAQENDIRLNQREIERYYLLSNQGNYWKWSLLMLIFTLFLYLLFKRHHAK
ncbi:MAG: hypothetical protein HFP81_08420 [Methylococcales symbiont of Hymedesmia sp. n. MRB-2018]|nr:MAG: hypothetical protein HFP81_08420 [Methylococcales symbiont of Hymedesmia sp. n. MRB-2018]